MQAELYVEPLGVITMTGSAVVIKTLNLETFESIQSIELVLGGGVVTVAGTVLTVYGSDATSGGNLTAIAAITIGVSNPAQAVLQIDGEDIGYAQDQAGLGPAGFKSLQWKATGTNTDTFKAALVAKTLHQRVGLTPSSVSALT